MQQSYAAPTLTTSVRRQEFGEIDAAFANQKPGAVIFRRHEHFGIQRRYHRLFFFVQREVPSPSQHCLGPISKPYQAKLLAVLSNDWTIMAMRFVVFISCAT